MPDLKTTFMGLTLKNPIVVASGPLTADINSLIKCEQAGAGAVVLKSIFEDTVNYESSKQSTNIGDYIKESDFSASYVDLEKGHYVDQYVSLISEAKAKLSIPVIASIHCTNTNTWTEYVKRFKAAGADALELNYYPIGSHISKTGEKVDKEALEFAKKVRKVTDLPFSLKIGYEYSSLSSISHGFCKEGVNGLVLFNNFFHPDINIEKETVCAMPGLTHADAYSESLRWIALLSADIKDIDFAASTGVHSGETVIKMILAGAKVTEVCSAVLKNGFGTITEMVSGVESWMDRKGYKTIDEFRGKLAQKNMLDGAYWERTQYMKNL
ncbi:MAG: dihydroorotate dehydrogenase-like protein [Sphaerochaetaceae bacterium]|nr:dihydroorotate dehydrogenase-like protein [Sphaerochaetaceae bacterium]